MHVRLIDFSKTVIEPSGAKDSRLSKRGANFPTLESDFRIPRAGVRLRGHRDAHEAKMAEFLED